MSDSSGIPPRIAPVTDSTFSATPADAATPADGSGQMVHGRYRLIAKLGEGGMGITYRAWDIQSGVPVVVKMPRREVRHDSAMMHRFSREIEAMRAVPHKNIVPITDSGDDAGCPFVVMRFLPGGSLADYRLDAGGSAVKNPPGMLHFWLPGVAKALDLIHTRGMVHRDVKPGNIFLDGFLNPFLGDFGIAKVVDESGGLNKEQTLTATKMAIGTPEYMAPELFMPRSPVDGRVDQYALAVSVYEMLAGEKPFKGDLSHIIVEHSSLPVPPLEKKCPGLPRTACLAVEKALAKNPTSRFATCAEFADAVLADLRPLEREADTVRLLCPSCKNILKLPLKAAGRVGRCPRCHSRMDVATDLGSLWLESEKLRAAAVELAPTAVASDQAVPEFSLDEPRWRLGRKEWVALAIMACFCLVMVGYAAGVMSQRRQTESPSSEIQAALAAAMEVEAKLRGERDALVAEHDRLAEDSHRLSEEVAAANEARDSALTEIADLATRTKELDAELLAARSAKQSAAEATSAAQLPLESLTNSIGIELKLLPAGTFRMGEVFMRGGTHQVTLTKPFYLGVYEVTNAQWKQVMGSVPSEWKEDDHPVAQVNWDEAMEFCRRLSAIPEEQKAGRVYRLPTEAEWEYACRAGTTSVYSFGDDDSLLGDYAWFLGNSGKQAHAVGQKKPNPWGFYDMHGNVGEWCSHYLGTSATDPQSPSDGSAVVARGGDWGRNAGFCRSAGSITLKQAGRPSFLGFRITLSPSESPELKEPGETSPEGLEAEGAPNDANADTQPVELLSLTNSIGMELKLLPAGTFTMGHTGGDSNERPHQVILTTSFYIGAYEVTNAQWKRVTGSVPSKWNDDDHPVEQVSWDDAIEFCRKLSAFPEEQKAGRVYRLPTEAEWEYACRAGTTTAYSFGDDESMLGEYAWFAENSGKQTHPVGQKKPNPWGLYDMHGNVREWCSDWYSDFPDGEATDPQGPAGSRTNRIYRGGLFSAGSNPCLSANRDGGIPSQRGSATGFRLALSPPNSDQAFEVLPDDAARTKSAARPAVAATSKLITAHKRFLVARCTERGYSLEEVMPCVVRQEGDQWTIDVNHPAYPRSPKPKITLDAER